MDRFERKGSVKSPPSFSFTLNWDINYLTMCETPTKVYQVRGQYPFNNFYILQAIC